MAKLKTQEHNKYALNIHNGQTITLISKSTHIWQKKLYPKFAY